MDLCLFTIQTRVFFISRDDNSNYSISGGFIYIHSKLSSLKYNKCRATSLSKNVSKFGPYIPIRSKSLEHFYSLFHCRPLALLVSTIILLAQLFKWCYSNWAGYMIWTWIRCTANTGVHKWDPHSLVTWKCTGSNYS